MGSLKKKGKQEYHEKDTHANILNLTGILSCLLLPICSAVSGFVPPSRLLKCQAKYSPTGRMEKLFYALLDFDVGKNIHINIASTFLSVS